MKKKSGFEKFMTKEKSGAAKKEHFRQEKKKITKERKEFFEKQRMEKNTKYDSDSYRERNTKSGETSGAGSAGSRGGHQPPTSNIPGRRSPIEGAKHRTSNIELKTSPASMPLNKYIAHCGICSRRDAVELIKLGKVKVNNEVMKEPGYKVAAGDEVIASGKKISPVKNMVYILLNKPKDYLTTTDDPQQRKTVLELIQSATPERVYPVGRLDRNTSGVLLLTNDGDLAQKLTHPSNEVKKLYAVTLNRPLTKNHFEDILKGVPLEDGIAHVDVLAFTDNADKSQVGIELHTGRNRIVRRIFEHYGYDVKNLDRVVFAGLTKKNVNRGKWRFLSEKEVRDLKYFKRGK